MKEVTLEHPDLPDRRITVSETAARVYRKSGWKTAKDEGQSSSGSTGSTTPASPAKS